jgi:hypothetical protein
MHVIIRYVKHKMNIQWHYAFQIIKERTQYLQWVTENILATYTSSVKDESSVILQLRNRITLIRKDVYQ